MVTRRNGAQGRNPTTDTRIFSLSRWVPALSHRVPCIQKALTNNGFLNHALALVSYNFLHGAYTVLTLNENKHGADTWRTRSQSVR